MEVLNVKVEKETKERIERLVKTKGYKNKSEALRKMIEDHFEEHPGYLPRKNSKRLSQKRAEFLMQSSTNWPQKISKERRTAAELVAEGRERS